MNGERQIALLQQVLRHLAQILANAALYAPQHPRVQAGLAEVLAPLQQLLKQMPELTLVVVKDDLLYLGKPLVQSPHTLRVARALAGRGIGHIKFLAGVADVDLHRLLGCLCQEESLEHFKEPQGKIRLGDVDVAGLVEDDSAKPVESFEHLTSEELKGLQQIFNTIGDQGQANVRQLVSLTAGFIVAFRREANPLLALAPLRRLDEYTFTHSINVGILNIAQGMSLGIEGQLLHDLGVAGMLHDSGKIFVDREIIQKPGKLSDAEWAIMKSHPSRGAQYLMNQNGVPKLAVISAYEHHMRFDLEGYPKPVDGWTLNLCSQMTMVSDTFDALRTRRIYKDPWDFPRVSGFMLSLAGTQLNKDLVINFLGLLAEHGENLPMQPQDDSVPARACYCE